jgi:hypothetical protein
MDLKYIAVCSHNRVPYNNDNDIDECRTAQKKPDTKAYKSYCSIYSYEDVLVHSRPHIQWGSHKILTKVKHVVYTHSQSQELGGRRIMSLRPAWTIHQDCVSKNKLKKIFLKLPWKI